MEQTKEVVRINPREHNDDGKRVRVFNLNLDTIEKLKELRDHEGCSMPEAVELAIKEAWGLRNK